MSLDKSIVIIANNQMRATTNQLADAMGFGNNVLITNLYTDDEQTHVGLHTFATSNFVYQTTVENPNPLLANLIISIEDRSQISGRDHFKRVVDENNLTERIIVDPDDLLDGE